MSLTKLLADASNQVNQIATARTDRGTRASALRALGRQIDENVRRLDQENHAADARARGMNPISQVDGD